MATMRPTMGRISRARGLPLTLARRACALVVPFVLAGCRQPTEVAGPLDPSPSMSELDVSEDSLAVGDTATLSLRIRAADGTPIPASGLAVEFVVESGTSDLGIGPTEDHGDGMYTAPVEAVGAGTPARIGATIDGLVVTSTLPTVTVVDGSLPGDQDGDGVPDADDGCPTEPGPASNDGCPEEPPPPPPTGECEASTPARCWYVEAGAVGGDGSEGAPFGVPQEAVTRANPGDFIYLSGTFGTEIGQSGGGQGATLAIDPQSGGRDGQPGALITVKPWPGRTAWTLGTSSTRLDWTLNRSYWRMEGIRVEQGVVFVAWYFVSDVRGVEIVGNEIGPADAASGNFGLIRVHSGDASSGLPDDILIEGNYLHDLYDGSLAWDEDPDVEHHACFMIQKGAGVTFRGNEAARCPAIFYFKYNSPGPILVESNSLHDAQRTGFCRAVDQTFVGNTLTSVPFLPSSGDSDACETR